jgi:hypothetical protein
VKSTIDKLIINSPMMSLYITGAMNVIPAFLLSRREGAPPVMLSLSRSPKRSMTLEYSRD